MPRGDGFAGLRKHEAKDRLEMARTKKRWEEDELDSMEYRAKGLSTERGKAGRNGLLRTGWGNTRGHRIFFPKHGKNYRKDIELK